MLNNILPRDPRLRAFVLAVATLVATLITTQFILPGDSGPGRGTPMAVLFQGLVTGAVLSLFTTGIILIYRTLRIVNFAQGPIGAVAASLFIPLFVLTPVPFPVAFLIGLVFAAAMGATVGIFLLRFFNSSRLFLTVVTIVGATVFFNLIPLIQQLPFYPSGNELTSEQARGLQPGGGLRNEMPFPGFEFFIGDLEIPFGFGEIFALELSVVALLGVAIFLRFTRAGVAIRALAENPERASLLGIGVGGLTVIVWAIVGALDFCAGASAVAGAPVVGQGFEALIPPLAAAAIAGFYSLPRGVFAAVLIGITRLAWNSSFEDDQQLYFAFLLAAVFISLLSIQRKKGRSEAVETSWAATTEPRPVPKELAGVTPLRVARWSLIVIGIFAVIVFPFLASTQRVNLAGVICITAIAVLSLVVLTGWAGQISLGQFAFVAIGSVVGGSLTSRVGIPFWFAVPMATAITGAVAVLVGLPALRIRGLYLLVTTFIFAVAVQALVFNEDYFGWLLPKDAAVERPTLFFLNFEDERSMYYLCVASLVLAIIVVVNLRRSRVGRVLIALRENENNVQAFGVSALRMKLVAFAIAGSLAGFAGAIFAHQARDVAEESFTAAESVNVFIAGVIGGVSSPGGALLGAAYFQLVTEFQPPNPAFRAFLNAGGPLLILFMAPGGLISVVNQVRDSVLRIVAQRRRIVVPSLFADYDPDLLDRQLIPLAEPDHSSGLAALPTTERFVLRSELYKGRGERVVDKLGPVKEAKEAAAIGAAARSFSDVDPGENS